MKMRNISILVLEIIWLVTGVVCVAAAVKFALTTGGIKTFLFVLMAIVSFTFAWLRHKQRKKE